MYSCKELYGLHNYFPKSMNVCNDVSQDKQILHLVNSERYPPQLKNFYHERSLIEVLLYKILCTYCLQSQFTRHKVHKYLSYKLCISDSKLVEQKWIWQLFTFQSRFKKKSKITFPVPDFSTIEMCSICCRPFSNFQI